MKGHWCRTLCTNVLFSLHFSTHSFKFMHFSKMPNYKIAVSRFTAHFSAGKSADKISAPFLLLFTAFAARTAAVTGASAAAFVPVAGAKRNHQPNAHQGKDQKFQHRFLRLCKHQEYMVCQEGHAPGYNTLHHCHACCFPAGAKLLFHGGNGGHTGRIQQREDQEASSGGRGK